MSNKTQIGIRFDNALLARLDAYCASLAFRTDRTALIEAAVRQMLDREEPKDKRRP